MTTTDEVSSDFEYRPCPNACTPDDEFILSGADELHHVPGRFTVVGCRRCGLLRTEPRPKPDAMGRYYPTDYAPYSSETIRRAPTKPWRAHLFKLLGLDTRRCPVTTPGSLLEVGCSSGNYMAEMQASGWRVEGIEFSADAAAIARERGFQVQTSTVEAAAPPEKKVDLICAWMVLEHLHEPISALRKMRQWIQPSGWLILSIPDAGALERRLFKDKWYALQLPTHLYHFDAKSIRKSLETAGWRLERLRWQKNANNLLWSLEYLFRERPSSTAYRFAHWLRTASAAAKVRIALGWLLGICRQSGRMEIWARPQ